MENTALQPLCTRYSYRYFPLYYSPKNTALYHRVCNITLRVLFQKFSKKKIESISLTPFEGKKKDKWKILHCSHCAPLQLPLQLALFSSILFSQKHSSIPQSLQYHLQSFTLEFFKDKNISYTIRRKKGTNGKYCIAATVHRYSYCFFPLYYSPIICYRYFPLYYSPKNTAPKHRVCNITFRVSFQTFSIKKFESISLTPLERTNEKYYIAATVHRYSYCYFPLYYSPKNTALYHRVCIPIWIYSRSYHMIFFNILRFYPLKKNILL